MEGISRCLSLTTGGRKVAKLDPLSNDVKFIVSPCDTTRNKGRGTEKSIDRE